MKHKCNYCKKEVEEPGLCSEKCKDAYWGKKYPDSQPTTTIEEIQKRMRELARKAPKSVRETRKDARFREALF